MQNCQPCKMTKRELEKNHIDYTEVDLSQNPDVMETMRSKGFLKAPIVVPSEGDAWTGFAPSKIKALIS